MILGEEVAYVTVLYISRN